MVETGEGSEPCPARVSGFPLGAVPPLRALLPAAAGGRWGGAPLRGRRVPAVPQPCDSRSTAPVPPAARREPPGRLWGAQLGQRQRRAQRHRPGVDIPLTAALVSVPVFRELTTVAVLISYRICFNGRTGVAEEDSKEEHPAACACSPVQSLMKESVCQHPLVKTALILRVQYFLRAVSYRQIFKRFLLCATGQRSHLHTSWHYS